jgi:3-hydroxyisobutyrate dehydrogenase-like beta-hydroxyacid dehydrogenase
MNVTPICEGRTSTGLLDLPVRGVMAECLINLVNCPAFFRSVILSIFAITLDVVAHLPDSTQTNLYISESHRAATVQSHLLDAIWSVISNRVYFSTPRLHLRVAFLGLGIMGRSMAANLVKAGHEVSVWNRTPGKTVEGARVASTPADAANGVEVVWMCVADTDAVEQVLFGENGVESVLASGMTVVDSSTISPAATRKFAERVRASGAEYVDSPVTGSKIAAEEGKLVFIVGGDDDVVQKLDPLFAAMGKLIVPMGENGKGQTAKLGMNLMIALIYEGFAEALVLTSKLGLPPERLLELVQKSMVRSGVTDYKAPFVLQRDFSPNFPLRLMHKDIRLMLEAAHEVRAKLPGLETVEEVYDIAAEEGMNDQDYAATLELLEKWAGVQVKATTTA